MSIAQHLRTRLVVVAGWLAPAGAAAQVHHHQAAPPTPLDLPMARDASGTSWQPDTTPMFMWHWLAGDWAFNLHANVYAGFVDASSDRGAHRFAGVNWVMFAARHAMGDGGADLTLRTMLSLEPLTVGAAGYPLLLQTGESAGGVPLHDRQHPHDLLMELAVRARVPVADAAAVELYVAPSGEPAIGPPAFPHRFVGMFDPLAPLGHHWQDSTHISFGVVTAGVFTRRWKLEGSWFNGREPDEDRFDLDLRAPDSFAARLTVNPTDATSAQVSWARLDSPEQLEPAVAIRRTTASAAWNHAGELGVLAVYGRNDPSAGPSTGAGLVEAALVLAPEHTVFGRVELLEKTGHDLALPAALADRTFGMAGFSAGYVYDAVRLGDLVPGIGIVATVNAIGDDLAPFYGTRAPWGGMVFVRIRAPEM
ncbi:MAG: hypothetical protein KIT31_38955 [Deltaproteobacteria bacterium]|nr:hypothetical protein [Deltaproteobacteria bacterium]